jgi:hypothetical protein
VRGELGPPAGPDRLARSGSSNEEKNGHGDEAAHSSPMKIIGVKPEVR